MASKGNKGKGIKWKLLYAITGIIDAIQLIIDFTGVGILISEILEIIMPFVLIGYLKIICRVSMITKPIRLLSIVGATGLDAVTGGAAPFWVLDVWYIHNDVKKEDAEYNAAIQQEMMVKEVSDSMNQDGVRTPSQTAKPLNSGGVRAPTFNSKPPRTNPRITSVLK